MAKVNVKRSDRPSETWNLQDIFINEKEVPKPHLKTQLGALYEGDCLDILPLLKSKTIDVIFAGPPFRLSVCVVYGSSLRLTYV